MLPALMSTVVNVDVPVAVRSVTVAGEADEAPIVVPSIAPALMSTVARVAVPVALSVVNEPAPAVVPPMVTLSIAPELMSTEVITPVVILAVLRVVVPVTPNVLPIVNVPATAPLISTSSVSMCAVPSKYKSLNSKPDVPKSISLVITGIIAPSEKRNCSTAAEDTSTKTPT